MISLWGREEGPEYETKIRNISVFLICLTAAYSSSAPLFIDLCICFHYYNLYLWRIFNSACSGKPRSALCHSRVTPRFFRSPLKWSPTLGFKAFLWWKMYDLYIKKEFWAVSHYILAGPKDAFHLHSELVLTLALKNKNLQWFMLFWSRAWIWDE